MISLNGWDVFVKESTVKIVGVLKVYEDNNEPYILAVTSTGEVVTYGFRRLLLRRPKPAEPVASETEGLLEDARMYLRSCLSRIPADASGWYKGLTKMVALLDERAGVSKDGKPAPKHQHTEALERLVKACLDGYDSGVDWALKAAQDALKDNK